MQNNGCQMLKKRVKTDSQDASKNLGCANVPQHCGDYNVKIYSISELNYIVDVNFALKEQSFKESSNEQT